VVESADLCISFDIEEAMRVKSGELMSAKEEGLFILADFFGH